MVSTDEQIPLSSPDVSEAEIDAVVEVLRDRQLSLGPRLKAFEQAVAEYAGTRHAVAVSSGTAALHLAVRGLGWGAGDEVVTTPFSFISSSNCLLFEGITPIFADIDPGTWDLDPAAAESVITDKTRGLLPVDVFGRPCPMDAYLDIASRHGLDVLEDSCEAIGTTSNGRAAGSRAKAGAYAFYPNKQITTGEGGMLITDDEGLAMLADSMRNQGRGEGSGWLGHPRLGFNYRIPDILCAMGIVQMQRLEGFVAERRRVFETYGALLDDIEDITAPLPARDGERISWFVYVVTLPEGTPRNRRDAILEELRKRGIGCRNYFVPIHLQPFYRERFGFRAGMFPVTESVAERTIALPFFNALSEAQCARVVAALSEALDATRHLAHSRT